jgi:hypothetical protein
VKEFRFNLPQKKHIRKAYPIAALLTSAVILAGCAQSKDKTITPMSWDFKASVIELKDTANPNIGSDRVITPNIPQYIRGPKLPSVTISHEGFFEIDCDENKIIGKNPDSKYVYMGNGDANTLELVPSHRNSDGSTESFSNDPNKITVSKKEYEDRIKDIIIKIDGKDVKKNISTNPNVVTSELSTSILNAYDFAPGRHLAECYFTTWNGITNTSNVDVVILNDRPS